MDFKDYYQTLGVAKTANEKEIKQAYRKLARKLHPDVNPGDKAAEARFKEINEANEVLSDPEKRKKYDELGANWRMYEQQQREPGGASPFTWGTPGGAGYRTVTEEFATTRPAFRWRQLIALARVTASEHGRPAPGVAEAREMLKV